jgi:3-hydroxyisobutyrate dehydrogenase
MDVAFVGLGTMGSPIAQRILAGGHSLAVCDVRENAAAPLVAQGARFYALPADAARGADVVLLSLPGPQEVRAVVLGANGIGESVAKGAVVVDLSTSSRAVVREVHDHFAHRGVGVIDAPVSGGAVGARAGTLQLMVGGSAACLDQVRPILETFSDKIAHMGPIGAGTATKLVHNLIALSISTAMMEGLALGLKADLDPSKLVSVLQGGAVGRNMFLEYGLPKIIEGRFDDGDFTLRLAHKDVALALDLARECNVPMGLSMQAEPRMLTSLARGWGDRDTSSVFLVMKEQAGLP